MTSVQELWQEQALLDTRLSPVAQQCLPPTYKCSQSSAERVWFSQQPYWVMLNNHYLLLLVHWKMSVFCSFALVWGMWGLFPETGWGNTWGFFPFPELGGWRTAWEKHLLSLLAIHCVHLVCQKCSAAAVNAEQRLIAGCCSTRHGWGKLIAPCCWKGLGASFPPFLFPLVTLDLGSSP